MRKRLWIPYVVLGVVAAVLGGMVLLSGNGEESEARAGGSRPTATAPATTESTPATTVGDDPATSPEVSVMGATTDAAPSTTEAAPSTSEARVPVEDLEPHRAVFSDGKLYLRGTVPSEEIGEQYREKAAAVLGEENVVYEYTYDDRVPIPTDGTVEVAENILFDYDSTEIRPEHHSILDLAALALELFPEAEGVFYGHTDDRGSDQYNQRLSEARAQAIVDYLIESGVEPDRLTTIGLGESSPVAPNDSDQNRARNRRIEFKLIGLLN